MKKIIILLVSYLFVTGCASAYKMSEKTQILVNSMTKVEAMSVFHRAVDEADTSVNICRLEINTDPESGRIPTEFGFEVRAWKRGESKGSETLNGVKYDLYEKDYYMHQVRLDNIMKIHSQTRNDAVHYCSPDKAGDYEFIIFYTNSNYMLYGVEESSNDEFMAALVILAPQAELKTGIGF